MTYFRNYDEWKLATPPEYEREEREPQEDEPPPDIVDLWCRIDAGELLELGYVVLGGEA